MSATAAPIKSILPYFGGKRTLAPRIVAEFGRHHAYGEICCGSLAVLMGKQPAAMEVVCDLYGHVINLARFMVSDRWEELCGRLARTLMHDDVFLEAKANAADEDLSIELVPAESSGSIEAKHIDAAYWFFILSWMGRNGAAGTRGYNQTISTRYTSNGGSGGLRWCQAVDSIPAWRD